MSRVLQVQQSDQTIGTFTESTYPKYEKSSDDEKAGIKEAPPAPEPNFQIPHKSPDNAPVATPFEFSECSEFSPTSDYSTSSTKSALFPVPSNMPNAKDICSEEIEIVHVESFPKLEFKNKGDERLLPAMDIKNFNVNLYENEREKPSSDKAIDSLTFNFELDIPIRNNEPPLQPEIVSEFPLVQEFPGVQSNSLSPSEILTSSPFINHEYDRTDDLPLNKIDNDQERAPSPQFDESIKTVLEFPKPAELRSSTDTDSQIDLQVTMDAILKEDQDDVVVKSQPNDEDVKKCSEDNEIVNDDRLKSTEETAVEESEKKKEE